MGQTWATWGCGLLTEQEEQNVPIPMRSGWRRYPWPTYNGGMAAPNSQQFMRELLLQNYHTQGTKMVILHDFITNSHSSHEKSEWLPQFLTEAERGSESLFCPKPTASKLGFKSRGGWFPNPGRDELSNLHVHFISLRCLQLSWKDGRWKL